MFDQINFFGLIIGFFAFLVIGISHPVVIKAEYHFGKKVWWIFFLAGMVFSIFSLLVHHKIVSILLGVIGFSAFWSTFEIFKQHERVLKGRAKKNPKRNY